MDTLQELEELGFTSAAEKAKRLKERNRKLMLAYENYRYVRKEKIDAFNQKLHEKTIKRDKTGTQRYQSLIFVSIGQYDEIPPTDVLVKLREAKERKCFDTFEIAKIHDVVKVPDPILFGCIEGCTDKFFIAQWDNDVSIDDILKPNEG